MQLRILLALIAIFPYILQATPLPECIHNINQVHNIPLIHPMLNNLNLKKDRLRVLSKQSLTFIKNNYGYIGSIIVLVLGVHWWYKQLTRPIRPQTTNTRQPQPVTSNRLLQVHMSNQLTQLQNNSSQQINLLSMLFDFDTNWQGNNNITQSLTPDMFIQQINRQVPHPEPHIISFNDTPFFSTSAYIEHQNHLNLKIRYLAYPTEAPMHIIIRPRDTNDSTKKLLRMFAAHAHILFTTKIAPVYRQTFAPIEVVLPLISTQQFSQHTTCAMNDFNNDLNSILAIEDRSHTH